MTEDLYEVVCKSVWFGHNKGESPEKTFNRVFDKILRMTLGESVVLPVPSRDNVAITLEERSLDELRAMTRRPARDPSKSVYPVGFYKHFKSKVRKTRDIPVVVASFKGAEYLLDGNRRVHYWTEMRATSLKVYVCRIS